MSDFRLVQPLFDGPLDVVADIHGEIEAVRALLFCLGYDERGWHPEGRRLVFLGDLTDRGPDSPAVVALVRRLVEAGLAQCVLGNHELNLLRGQEKHGNAWFLGKPESLDRSGRIVPQLPADAGTRAEILRFFRQLPLALEREDLRVVHACWDSAMVDLARDASDVLDLYDRSVRRIRDDLEAHGVTDDFEVRLALQNRNPVKVLTSGHERRAAEPFEAGGRLRDRERVRWWEDDADDTFCVFGHYWRTPVPDARKTQRLFDADPPHAALGAGRAMCIDYSAAPAGSNASPSISTGPMPPGWRPCAGPRRRSSSTTASGFPSAHHARAPDALAANRIEAREHRGGLPRLLGREHETPGPSRRETIPMIAVATRETSGTIRPDGEEEDHTSVLTRSPGFESWSGHSLSAALVVKRTIMPRF